MNKRTRKILALRMADKAIQMIAKRTENAAPNMPSLSDSDWKKVIGELHLLAARMSQRAGALERRL